MFLPVVNISDLHTGKTDHTRVWVLTRMCLSAFLSKTLVQKTCLWHKKKLRDDNFLDKKHTFQFNHFEFFNMNKKDPVSWIMSLNSASKYWNHDTPLLFWKNDSLDPFCFYSQPYPFTSFKFQYLFQNLTSITLLNQLVNIYLLFCCRISCLVTCTCCTAAESALKKYVPAVTTIPAEIAVQKYVPVVVEAELAVQNMYLLFYCKISCSAKWTCCCCCRVSCSVLCTCCSAAESAVQYYAPAIAAAESANQQYVPAAAELTVQ